MISGKSAIGFTRELVASLDPTLRVVQCYRADSFFGVCRVEQEGEHYVLRWSKKRICNDVETEAKALEVLEGVQRVPRLIWSREVEGYAALLKTYLPGETYSKVLGESEEKKVLGEIPGIRASLEKLVQNIHAAGVSYLDIKEENIVINNAEAYLFDFNTSLTREDQRRRYRLSIRIDNENVERLLTKGITPLFYQKKGHHHRGFQK